MFFEEFQVYTVKVNKSFEKAFLEKVLVLCNFFSLHLTQNTASNRIEFLYLFEEFQAPAYAADLLGYLFGKIFQWTEAAQFYQTLGPRLGILGLEH